MFKFRIKDIHFTLYTLKDIPGLVKHGAYCSSLDDKSGFDNIKLHPDSFYLMAFQWAGYIFCFRKIPFGFKLSSYVYHTLNIQAVSHIRRAYSIPICWYIDDRLIEQTRNISCDAKKVLCWQIISHVIF